MDNLERIIRKVMARKIHIITGPSGGGKSLFMTERICRGLIMAHWINNHPDLWRLAEEYMIKHGHQPRPFKVWANMDVGFSYRAADDGAEWPGADKYVELARLPLNFYKLYTFDDEMKFGFVFVDELDQKADRQDWQNGGQKLLMAILRQIRKRHLSLGATIQSLNWLNPRFLFQVDVVSQCRDSSFTRWGQENDVEPGAVVFLYSSDRSGRETGTMYEEDGRIYQSKLIGKRMFDYYNTDEEQDPFESMETISIKKKKIELNPFAGEEEAADESNFDNDIIIIAETLKGYVEKGELDPKRSGINQILKSKGLVMTLKEASEYMESIYHVRVHNKSGYWHYDLSQMANVEKVTE